MGIFDDIKGKAEELIGNNPDKVEELSDQGLDKATEAIDGATGGKFGDQIQQGKDLLDGKIGE